MMVVLGLDVSTAITGYCLLDFTASVNERLLLADAIVTSRIKDPYSKAAAVRCIFNDLKDQFDIDKIVVEENLQAFRRGFSSAKTLSTLARFNGVISFLAEDVIGAPVTMVNVNNARSLAGIKIDRKSDLSIKEQVLNSIKNVPEFQGFFWPTKTLKSGPRKGKTIDAPECFDIADAAVVCLAAIMLEQ
ncbi:MAG TPA: hypothetical protein EYN38_11110 [Flavobacteriales bacterium]|nr:hypothetical protein [Flavobacteriales bacterium]